MISCASFHSQKHPDLDNSLYGSLFVACDNSAWSWWFFFLIGQCPYHTSCEMFSISNIPIREWPDLFFYKLNKMHIHEVLRIRKMRRTRESLIHTSKDWPEKEGDPSRLSPLAMPSSLPPSPALSLTWTSCLFSGFFQVQSLLKMFVFYYFLPFLTPQGLKMPHYQDNF